MLEFPGEEVNLRKSAVCCENLRFGRSLCHLSSVPLRLSAPRPNIDRNEMFFSVPLVMFVANAPCLPQTFNSTTLTMPQAKLRCWTPQIWNLEAPWSSFPCLFGKQQGKPPKRQGFLLLAEPRKSLGKKGKTLKIARHSSKRKKARKTKKARKRRLGQWAWYLWQHCLEMKEHGVCWGMEMQFFALVYFQARSLQSGENRCFCRNLGIFMNFRPLKTTLQSLEIWPFHPPRIHTHTKCRLNVLNTWAGLWHKQKKRHSSKFLNKATHLKILKGKFLLKIR